MESLMLTNIYPKMNLSFAFKIYSMLQMYISDYLLISCPFYFIAVQSAPTKTHLQLKFFRSEL